MSEQEKNRKEEEDRVAAEKELEQRRKMSTGGAFQFTGRLPSAGSSKEVSESETDSMAWKIKRLRSPEERRKVSTKRSKTEIDSEAEEEEDVYVGDSLSNLDIVLQKMKEWWTQPTIMKMVTKPQTAKFARYLNRFQEEITSAKMERARVESRIVERKEIAKIVSSAIKEEMAKKRTEDEPKMAMTYSSAVRKESSRVPRVTGMKGPIRQAPKQVIVRHDTKESEEVTKVLKSLVRPSEIGLKVRRLVNIRNGVIIEAENEEGVENLMKQEALKKAGLNVEKRGKKKPYIMIYDVSENLKNEEIKNEVFSRNMGGSAISEEQFNQEFEVRHKYKDRKSAGKKCHVVVECSVQVRNWLRGKERVFVEWQSCRVKDYIDVARCFKCQRFGHVAKHCNSEKPSCSHCAGDHDFKECPHKEKKDKACCVNCQREKRENLKHQVGSRKCPVYEKAVKRHNEKIDYGS